MENPKILLDRLKNLFQVTCVFLAAYMAVKLSMQYLENKDATSILYRHYNKRSSDKYPTFSICFQGLPFHWYNDLELFRAFGIPASEYVNLLSGRPAFRYEYNLTSRLYKKTQAVMDQKLNAGFENFHIQFSDFAVKSEFATERPNTYYGKNNNRLQTNRAFYVGYQTPDMICFTRSSTDVIGDFRLYDHLVLKSSILNDTTYENVVMQLFIHHPQHLMRSIKNPFLTTTFSKYHADKLLEIVISQGTLLRKRHNSNEACNEAANEHDAFLIKEISKKFECVPPYWGKRLMDMLHLQQCESSDTLKKIHTYLQTLENLLESHDQPCLEMFNSVMYNWKPIEGEDMGVIKFTDSNTGSLDGMVKNKAYKYTRIQSIQRKNESSIKLIYRDRQYEEIRFSRGFGFESYWSGIGGFVGIFIGISIMQFPALLGNNNTMEHGVESY